MTRVASLLASGTEIVHALGYGDRLVARSHECDYPAEVAALPVVTEPKLATDGTSYEIDARVRALVQEALAVYRVDGDALRAAAPDLVVTQTQCEVCAVSLADVEAALASWLGERPRIVALAPRSLADVWDDIRRVAGALGAPERGEALVVELASRMDAIAERARALATAPTVACIEWIEPLMGAGNWMPELVERAGGVPLFGEVGRHTPWLAWDDLAAADPDVLVVVPCGFDLERTRSELGPLVSRPNWPGLRAVAAGRVALADGVQFFNRSGPRLVESLEILAEILHPESFGFGHRRRGWQPL